MGPCVFFTISSNVLAGATFSLALGFKTLAVWRTWHCNEAFGPRALVLYGLQAQKPLCLALVDV